MAHEHTFPNGDSKKDHPEAGRLSLEDARAFAVALDVGAVRLTRKTELSATEQDFVWGLTTRGAGLVVNLINNGNQLPPPKELGRSLHAIANADHHLFELSEVFSGHAEGTYSADKARAMLQEHEGHIQQYPRALEAAHRVNIEDSAIEIAHIVGGFVESNGGLQLDARGREYVDELARLHSAAFPPEQ